MIVGIIPCKIESRRLERKNFQMLNGKSLLQHSIDYLKTSSVIDDIYAYTTDLTDGDIQEHIERNPDVTFMAQPLDDGVPYEYLCELYFQIYHRDFKPKAPTLFVTTTPDNPFKPEPLDRYIIHAIQSNSHELIIANHQGYKAGSLHIINQEALEMKYISGYTKIFPGFPIDIHTQKDLERAEKLCLRLNQK